MFLELVYIVLIQHSLLANVRIESMMVNEFDVENISWVNNIQNMLKFDMCKKYNHEESVKNN